MLIVVVHLILVIDEMLLCKVYLMQESAMEVHQTKLWKGPP